MRCGAAGSAAARARPNRAVYLDMLSKALRESPRVCRAHHRRPSRRLLAEGATRAGVDVRRFPWIRPLVGRLRLRLPQASRRSTPAIRRAAGVARGDRATPGQRRHHRHRGHRRRPAGAPRRANAGARGGGAAGRSRHRRGRHRPAGGRVRRSALHIAQGGHRPPAGAPRVRRGGGATVVPVFWVDAEDHDWEEVRACTVLDAEFQPRTVTLAAPEGAGRTARRRARARRRRSPSASTPWRRRCRRPTFQAWSTASLREAYQPGIGMATRSRAGSNPLLGPHRPGRLRVRGPGGQAAGCASVFVAGTARRRGEHRALAAEAGERSPRSATAPGRAPARQPRAVPPDGVRTRHPPRRGTTS